jgi:hypothetical protein
MATYRCPKHDCVFESGTDHRSPGAPEDKSKKLMAHPYQGHPDCPICTREAEQAALDSK